MSRFIARGQEDPMTTLCRMAINTTYEDLPRDVIKYAEQSILDTIGVTIGGSAMEGIPAVVDLVKDQGGKPESFIPFYGGKVPASQAGLAIGPMARAMDMGQVHEEAGHNSEYVVAALLAATALKDKVSGREFVTAFVVGQEVLIRIGMAYKAVSKGSPTGRTGGHFIFGPVAAVGKLLGLSLDELANAEGIARTMTQPHDTTMYSPATLMVRVHHGFICQDAINACLLARRGITGPRLEVLGGPKGYLGLAKWETEPEALTRGLGEQWEMLNVMVKSYSSCQYTHTSITGILYQMKEHSFEAGDIASISMDEASTNWNLVCIPRELKWNPWTVSDCQFSLPYTVATAAYDKHIFLDSYTPQAMARRDVRELMSRVSAKHDPSLPPFAARVYVALKNGKTYSREYTHAKGHPNNPLTERELVDKFKKCVPYAACTLSGKVVDSLIEVLLSLRDAADVQKAVILPLVPGEPR